MIRRTFLQRATLGAAALAGASYVGLLFARSSSEKLLDGIARLRQERLPCPPLPGLHDLGGVIHVHSRVSPNSRGTPEEIIQAAEDASLHFVLTTDYNDRKIFTEGMQGRMGDILVIRGAELINQGECLLAINLKEYIDNKRLTLQQAVDEIKSQGGLAFVAHPWRFKQWEVQGLDGMEIFDVADSTYAHVWKLPVMLASALTPGKTLPEEAFLRGPLSRSDSNLRKWDTLTQGKKFVGIAGNDAHQNVRLFRRLLDPYPLNFKFVQTHVLAMSLEETSLLQGLQAGHAYCSFSLLADATGFQFLARNAGTLGIMGDNVSYSSRPILTVQAPNVGWISLFHNGQLIQEAHSNRLDHAVRGKGIYRAEVSLPIDGQLYPWIFSNPIYVV